MSELVLSALSKSYGHVVAVNTVDLAVPAGARMAIVGPSGSGKTSLLRLIAGFEAPDAGRILLRGEPLNGEAGFVPPHRRDIGYVPQEGALFPHLSIAANIGFGLARTAGRQERVAELLQQVGLPPDFGSRRPHELSGGQQQRVALARAMARKPRIMLLDEPFSALDAGLREAMRDMVAAILGEAGITTILVTHDQAEALSFAHLLAVMREGRLIQSGTPQSLYLHPVDPATARFLGEAIILPAMVEDGLAHTLLGPVPVNSAAGRKTIMLRPEQLRLTPAEAEGGTRARVVSQSFEGASWRTIVEHLPQQESREPVLETASVFTLRVPGAAPLTPGSLVSIRLTGTAHVFEG